MMLKKKRRKEKGEAPKKDEKWRKEEMSSEPGVCSKN
jgi:hypothetical protein